MKTTLNAIKKHSPCKDGYWKLLRFLGKTKADTEVLDLSVIFESNGFLDTVWSFRAVSGQYPDMIQKKECLPFFVQSKYNIL